MKIHFIAIGGAAMHNLAIALHKKGYEVSGSDDEIFNPSKARLEKYGLLPKDFGWFPQKISNKIDFIILGMHARPDNPELIEAQKQGLKIFSYPEFLYHQTQHKKRLVIGGSHGKTTITSMIMHVLKSVDIKFDYMVGANIKGFDTMVELNENNKIAVFEGDEYLSSPIDLTPKFHWYKPHVAILTGIAWDHINVFPSFDNYVDQFKIFVQSIIPGGKLFWFEEDKNLKQISNANTKISQSPYNTYKYIIDEKSNICVKYEGQTYKMNVFGDHNMQNINAARLACLEVGVKEKDFWNTIQNFEGAAKRLQLIKENSKAAFYIDFAHAPSKLKATIKALKQKYPNRKLIACMELHTFSSLQKNFLPQYNNCMKDADIAVVYYSHEVIKHKKLPNLDENFVSKSFGKNIKIFTDTNELKKYLSEFKYDDTNLLMMSSGNFNGIDFDNFANDLIIE